MTLIAAKLFKSGTTTPLTGSIKVLANSSFVNADRTNVPSVVTYTLISGEVTFDLVPTDSLKTAYNFRVYEAAANVGDLDTLLYSFDAAIPSSVTPINFNTLVSQLGLRYDLRDSSLLTLARYLVTADPFINFLGSKLWANKGEWNATAVYRRGDIVIRQGSSYQYVDSSQTAGLLPESNPTKWQLLVVGVGAASLVIGTMVLFSTGTSAVPGGYLKCDGRAVSRSTYSALFSVIGTIHGSGDGITTFNLPTSPINGDGTFYIAFSGSLNGSNNGGGNAGGGSTGSSSPIGSMMLFPAYGNLPAQWLRCDGSAVSRTAYATLFSVIGTNEGVGNGTTTFNLPTSAITGGANTIIFAGA